MHIPCQDDLRWYRIHVLAGTPVGTGTMEDLRRRIGHPDQDGDYTLVDGKECHSYARIDEHTFDRVSDTDDSEEPRSFWMLSVRTFRHAPHPDVSDSEQISHRRFFEQFWEWSQPESLYVRATVSSFFDASSASWRLPLLASPPEVGDLESDLGIVSVKGLKLSFTDSEIGLSEVQLETSPDGGEYSVSVVFGEEVEQSSLFDLYAILIDKARELSNLFIIPKGPKGV